MKRDKKQYLAKQAEQGKITVTRAEQIIKMALAMQKGGAK